MRIEQLIEGLDIDFTGFDGMRQIEPLSAGELQNLKDVATPWPEDLDVVRKSLDQLLSQLPHCNGSTDAGTPPSPSELKRVMGRCFQMGRKYEQLRSVTSLDYSQK